MTWVRFRVELPPESWLGDVSQSVPAATYRLSSVVVDDERGHVLLTISGTEHSAVIEGLEGHEEVSVVDQLGGDGTEMSLHVTAQVPSIIAAFQRAGTAFDPPITIVDGKATLEIAGQHERVSSVGRELATIDPGYEVVLVGQYDAATRVLTDTQRELVLAAIDAGYYDTPRRCTLTALAERQGIAKSTCSETLQRAHERVMKRFAADVPTGSHTTTESSSTDHPEEGAADAEAEHEIGNIDEVDAERAVESTNEIGGEDADAITDENNDLETSNECLEVIS